MHIDMHAHFFNTRYIPVAGVAMKYKKVPELLARFIARGIRAATPDDNSLEHDGSWFASDSIVSEFALAPEFDPPPRELTPDEAIEKFVAEAPSWLINSKEFEQVVSEAMPVAKLAPVTESLALVDSEESRREWLREYLRTPGVARGGPVLEAPQSGPKSVTDVGLGGLLAFLHNLTSREKTLADNLRRSSAGVGLFIHLMMDMQWPYEDEPHYDYPRQIRRIRRLCRQSGGRIIPFVAFDAYRPDSQRLVEDALLHQSFVGVKFYAPSGYAPSGNINPDIVLSRKDVSRAELDRRCARLIAFCADWGIPIMAHCTPQGMEAMPKEHSGFNADPHYWRDKLKEHPSLRLCFGHAGGRGRWFPGEPEPDDTPDRYPWADAIIELCGRYPNVYCDFSHMSEAMDVAGADAFANALADAIDRTPTFGTKVMYGTDYPMPMGSGEWQVYYDRILACVRRNPRLARHEGAFFRQNAVGFLNLGRFINERGRDLAPEQARYLLEYT